MLNWRGDAEIIPPAKAAGAEKRSSTPVRDASKYPRLWNLNQEREETKIFITRTVEAISGRARSASVKMAR
jgi:hypothetical protein